MLLEPSKSRLRMSRTIMIAVGLGGLLGLTAIGLLVWRPTPGFPASLARQVEGFRPYYFKRGFVTDFVMQRQTLSYHSGVLVFALKNPVGKTLVFTEQAAPPNFDPSVLITTKQFSNEYGRAVITDDQARTTGALLTQDKTWVIINAPNPVGADTMQQILQALVPVQS
jgi:hypothetical protein